MITKKDYEADLREFRNFIRKNPQSARYPVMSLEGW